MNIQQVKETIKNTVLLYLKKDEFGEYRIPVVRQRPVFLLGSPGIGKTAIMEQVAAELDIALVSYSMTHHTRQSALGLPFIDKKIYDGKEYSVSEYTMSEIIASVYETMEASGKKEGILFLDEINCVSETLAPAMLQFLQYKEFGRHAVPEGWVIVTAGNPPEYNKSVREFDVVTLDRMKIVQVEADYPTWKKYAVSRGVHNSIITYLDMKKQDYYLVETVAGGKNYVTARGWEDLSTMIILCEEEGITVDENLVGQYLHHERIVKEFTVYYDLYNRYKNDYRISDILEGKITVQTKEKARVAKFDERLSLLGMLIDSITGEIADNSTDSRNLKYIMAALQGAKKQSEEVADFDMAVYANSIVDREKKQIESLKAAGTLTGPEKNKKNKAISFWENMEKESLINKDIIKDFAYAKSCFNEMAKAISESREKIDNHLHNTFVFVEEAFRDGNEMTVLMTELTVREACAEYIATYGCEDYTKHNEDLILNDRQREIMEEIRHEWKYKDE